MLKSTRFLAVAFLGLGTLLGYAAASGRLNPFHKADAAPPVPDVAKSQAATDPSHSTCCSGTNKSDLIALAHHNTEVAEKAEKSGKRAEKSPRDSFLYCNDDQQLTALRYDNWKLVFMEQRVQGTFRIWSEPFVTLRVPKLFNLRTDPYERADITSNTYYDWFMDHVFLLVPAQEYVAAFLMTFKEYPQRQKAASFNLDEVLRNLKESGGSK